METLGSRLKMVRGDLSGEDFAKLLGVNHQTIYRYERHERIPDASFLVALCKNLHVSAEWLLLGSGPMHSPAQNPPAAMHTAGVTVHTPPTAIRTPGVAEHTRAVAEHTADIHHDTVFIPRVAPRLIPGSNTLQADAPPQRRYAFSSKWLTSKGNMNHMVLMRVTGNSMTPEIAHGDLVLIDLSHTAITAYGLYAVGVEDAVCIKQLRLKPGQLILHSLNDDYDDIVVDTASEQQRPVRILGRVLWVGRDLA